MANIVKYEAKDGSEVSLSFETIKSYLVQGRADYVTQQEMMFFMGICKARGLNPFARDCYLIKYSEKDNAAIVTSIDYFRARAKAQKDCKGWQSGIIVERKGEVMRSKGLMLEGDKLLGGWFSATPDGWNDPFELEVNLNAYVKKTTDGKPTKFWQPENQPTMIRKVAESQGLREVWPTEFAKLYVQEEVDSGAVMDAVMDVKFTPHEQPNEPQAPPTLGDFELLSAKMNPDNLAAFLTITAEKNKSTVDALKVRAVSNWDSFEKAYKAWVAKQKPAKAKKELEPEPPPVADPPADNIACPDGALVDSDKCMNHCDKAKDCAPFQAWLKANEG
jgi:phage recombination protein Bet